MKKMGGLGGLMDKLPTQMMGGKAANIGQADMDRAERDMRRMEGIINSMTPTERRKPDLLKATRKRRVAAGAGVHVQDVNRLLNQFEQMRDMMKKMGGLGGLVDKLPSQMMGGKAANIGQADMDRAERDMRRMEGIICSMTPLERRKPDLLKATRKRRIAAGAGVQVQDVNRLLNQFEQMRDMMKKMKGGGMMKMMKRMGAGMKGMGGPGGMR